MGLVPGDNLQGPLQCPAAFGEGLGNYFQIGVRVLRERSNEMLATGSQYFLDQFERRDVVVRRAASPKPCDEIREAGVRVAQPFCSEQFFGDPDVQQLPGDVCTLGAGPPAERVLRVVEFAQGIDQNLRALTIHFPQRLNRFEVAHCTFPSVGERLSEESAIRHAGAEEQAYLSSFTSFSALMSAPIAARSALAAGATDLAGPALPPFRSRAALCGGRKMSPDEYQ